MANPFIVVESARMSIPAKKPDDWAFRISRDPLKVEVSPNLDISQVKALGLPCL